MTLTKAWPSTSTSSEQECKSGNGERRFYALVGVALYQNGRSASQANNNLHGAFVRCTDSIIKNLLHVSRYRNDHIYCFQHLVQEETVV